MRILHVVHHFPPELFGGTQSYVAALARLQQGRGHEPRVVAGANAPGRGGEVEEDEYGGVPVTRIYRDLPGEAHAGHLGSPRIGAIVRELARDGRFDLVHVHHWDTLTSDLVRLLAAEGLPVVLTLHDLFTTCARSFRLPDARSFCSAEVGFDDCARCLRPDAPGTPLDELEETVRRRFESFQGELRAAARVLAMSRAQADLLRSLPGFDFDALEVLPIGIGERELAPVEGWEPVPGRLRIVNWAGLDPRKGIHLLLSAVRESELRDRMEVHLFGRGGDAAYMRELEQQAEGVDVRFHGPFRDEDRPSFARLADVAVFPFLAFETHGLVVDEALRMGMAVLVPDHGAPVERVAGKGFAVARGDVAGLRSALEWLLDQPDEVERMRSAPPRLFTLEQHAARLADVYGAVVP